MGAQLTVGIIGGSGFAGGELCRLLLNHPDVSNIIPFARSLERFENVHQNLHGCGLEFQSFDEISENLSALDVAYFCTPAGIAMQKAEEFYNQNVPIIDLSPDFRFSNADSYERVYGRHHNCPELLEKAVYGVSEFNREDIRQAKIVANPGCYVITVLLAIRPLIEAGWVSLEHPVTVSAINGTSGAGKKSKAALMHAGVHGNILPYSLEGHRHGPELEEQLSELAKQEVRVHLTTAHGAFTRGIFAQITLHANPNKAEDISREVLIQDCANSFSKSSNDIQFVFANQNERKGEKNAKDYEIYPKVARVEGSNFCHVGVDYDAERRLIKVVSVTDNLVKGAAGSAIQNMNIMFGLSEGAGLSHYGL